MEVKKKNKEQGQKWVGDVLLASVLCVCIYVCLSGSDSVALWQRDKLIRTFSVSLNNVLSPYRVYVIN